MPSLTAPLSKEQKQHVLDLAEIRRALHFGETTSETFEALNRLRRYVYETSEAQKKGRTE